MSTPSAQSMPDALRSDHRAIADLLADPANATQTPEALEAREELVTELVRHFVAEEQYLYPTVRDRLEDGAQRADAGFDADRGIEEQLKALEDPDLDLTQLALIWARLSGDFVDHIDRQNQLFTDLVTACSPDELLELGDGIAGAEQLAPTRPRRLALESPSVNKLLSFVEGFVDHARDYYSRRGAE